MLMLHELLAGVDHAWLTNQLLSWCWAHNVTM